MIYIEKNQKIYVIICPVNTEYLILGFKIDTFSIDDNERKNEL